MQKLHCNINKYIQLYNSINSKMVDQHYEYIFMGGYPPTMTHMNAFNHNPEE